MTYAISGQDLTQSGTYANLSWLASVSGITVSSYGTQYKEYICPYRFIIAGSQTIDPEKERLISTYPMPATGQQPIIHVISGGILTIGTDAGPSTIKRKTSGVGIVISDYSNVIGNISATGRLTVESGGTLYLYGDIVTPQGEIFFKVGSTVVVQSGGIWNTYSLSFANIRCQSTGISFTGLRTNCAMLLTTKPTLISKSKTSGAARAIVFYGSNNFAQPGFRVDSLEIDPTVTYDLEFIDSAYGAVYNTVSGSDLRIRNWTSLGNPSRTAGYVRTLQTVSFYLKTGGSQVDGVTYLKDINNGLRTNQNGFDDTADKVYINASDISTGTGNFDVVTCIWNKIANGDVAIDKDIRFSANDTAIIHFLSYYGVQTQIPYSLRYGAVLSDTIELLPDVSITKELSVAQALLGPTVAISTAGSGSITISLNCTLDDIYDACKAFKCTANVDHVTFPSVTSQICVAVGKRLSTTLQIVITDGVIVSKGEKFTSLESSSTITVGSFSELSFTYIDSTGTYVKVKAPGISVGSRVQLYNITDSVQVYNDLLIENGFTITTLGSKSYRLRCSEPTKGSIETFGSIGTDDFTFTDIEQVDKIYISNAVNGADCTEFIDDDTNVDILISDPDGVTSLKRLYAWSKYYNSTADGISGELFKVIKAASTSVYQIDSSRGSVVLNNVSPVPVRLLDGTLEATDGSSVIHPLSGSIQIPGNAYAAPNTAEEIATVVEAKLNVALNQVLDNLLGKADKTDVSALQTAIGTRATPADLVTTQSAITTALSSGLSVKADKTDISGVISALSNKPDTFDLTQTETNITTAIASGLSTKADKTDVAGVATSVASVAATLMTKADKSDITATQTAITTAIDAGLLNKADKTDVATIVATVNDKPGQAELTAVETAITTAIDAGLVGKADKTDLAPLAKESSIKNVISFIASS